MNGVNISNPKEKDRLETFIPRGEYSSKALRGVDLVGDKLANAVFGNFGTFLLSRISRMFPSGVYFDCEDDYHDDYSRESHISLYARPNKETLIVKCNNFRTDFKRDSFGVRDS
ncbi:hypothetical protein CMI42_02795 [Candidatus Pacearchaeota archaeon]|nr:hypothetical protein [Candidatus Pacearchaeota archaeon]|tara:strand:- start:699 stop:1040 length:342 start_codon:yes stop_codon:yes gene_type:complete